jgi:hypothetical protein
MAFCDILKAIISIHKNISIMMQIKSLVASAGMAVLLFGSMAASAAAAGGFNQYGYNYQARVFSGAADGVDKNIDGTVWGDPTYAQDHLVMKWNAQWDNCNARDTDRLRDLIAIDFDRVRLRGKLQDIGFFVAKLLAFKRA